MLEKWDTIEKSEPLDFRIFSVARARKRHPLWQRESSFVVLNAPDWVNIIPLTDDGNIILIRQYRHGTEDFTIEIPGGMVEPGEDHPEAAMRECTEETGYYSDNKADLLGITEPNPAFLNNHCHSFLWTNCHKIKEQNLDHNEDIEVIEMPMTQLRTYIQQGNIRHSLVLDAFFFYDLKYGL